MIRAPMTGQELAELEQNTRDLLPREIENMSSRIRDKDIHHSQKISPGINNRGDIVRAKINPLS